MTCTVPEVVTSQGLVCQFTEIRPVTCAALTLSLLQEVLHVEIYNLLAVESHN